MGFEMEPPAVPAAATSLIPSSLSPSRPHKAKGGNGHYNNNTATGVNTSGYGSHYGSSSHHNHDAASGSNHGGGGAGNGGNGEKDDDDKTIRNSSGLSRQSSFGSIEPEDLLNETCFRSSDELDKLSQCLSTVRSASTGSSDRETDKSNTSVFYDVIQAQLCLWTAIGTLIYSYAWRQHRKKFIATIILVLPPVLTLCCALSGLLTGLVVVSRLCYTSPFGYRDFLNFASRHAERVKNMDEAARSPSPSAHSRIRSYSGDSISVASSSATGDGDLLPKPLCRRHSSTSSVCQNSLLLSSASSHATGCASRPPSRKLSYAYSHRSASQEAGINDAGK